MIMQTEMKLIKKTKSVEMNGDKDGVGLRINPVEIWIPMKSVFQVKRGLESYIQKFYRKHKKVGDKHE